MRSAVSLILGYSFLPCNSGASFGNWRFVSREIEVRQFGVDGIGAVLSSLSGSRFGMRIQGQVQLRRHEFEIHKAEVGK